MVVCQLGSVMLFAFGNKKLDIIAQIGYDIERRGIFKCYRTVGKLGLPDYGIIWNISDKDFDGF